MDEAFIVVSIISGIFGILGLELMTHNWFRKERFKLEAYNMKAENKLRLKKLERELNLQPSNTIEETEPQTNLLTSYLPEIIKNLDPDQLAALADRFIPSSDEGGGSGSGSMVDGILEYAAKNPEVAKAFLGGLTGGKKTQDTGSQV